jgi:hypothetical protein
LVWLRRRNGSLRVLVSVAMRDIVMYTARKCQDRNEQHDLYLRPEWRSFTLLSGKFARTAENTFLLCVWYHKKRAI